MSRVAIPENFSRKISRAWRIFTRSAGIIRSFGEPTKRLKLTSDLTHNHLTHPGGIISLWWAASFRFSGRLRQVSAEIYFGDAAHIRSDHHAGRTWGKKGETPIVEATGARHGMSLISAVTSRGHMRFMIKEKGGVNAEVFIEFLKRLIVGAKHQIFLIVDRGPAHRAKKTKAFVEGLAGKLQLFFCLHIRPIATLTN
ncbi:MAG: hypothetical protein EB015_22125 [Methylocystaceae bacterium]|nr:hypothetical protein [Methylocystaceae bacterium]